MKVIRKDYKKKISCKISKSLLKIKKAAIRSWAIKNLTEDEKRLVEYKTKYYKSRKNVLWVGLNTRNWFW